MTLVYCSRDFSTLRSLYPRQYWSLTTEGGAARNSYKCKYICCCVILVLLCLLLSPVLAFLYHLFPFSFVRRSLSSSSVCLFVLVYFVVRAFDYTLCVLLRIRACTCAVSFVKISNFVKFRQISRKFQIFIFLIFRRILPRMTPADSTAISAFSSPCWTVKVYRTISVLRCTSNKIQETFSVQDTRIRCSTRYSSGTVSSTVRLLQI